jgi:MFS family permease
VQSLDPTNTVQADGIATPAPSADTGDNRRWLILVITCLGVVMCMLDGTVVNVALPSIRAILGFSEDSLVWVVNGYLVPVGGFLVLSGRLGDHYGHLRTVLGAIALFTVASFVCAIASTWWLFLVGRVLQGLGASAVSAGSLSVILQHFDVTTGRARALGIYSGITAGAGSAGVLLGGVLTDTLGWRFIFFINLLFGAAIYVLCRALRIKPGRGLRAGHLDVWGAVTVTVSLTLSTLALLNATKADWWSAFTWVPLCAALVCGALFVVIEARTQNPLIALTLFLYPNFRASLITRALQTAAMSIWFFIAALQLQRVLGYDAASTGLAFLPATFLAAVLPLRLSTRLVIRFGTQLTLIFGLLLSAAGLLILAEAPPDAPFSVGVLPSMLFLGFGSGLVNSPLALSAMCEVGEGDYGAASGVLTSAAAMTGVLGLASASALAVLRTKQLLVTGLAPTEALNGGYRLALMSAALCSVVAAIVSARIKAPCSLKSSIN